MFDYKVKIGLVAMRRNTTDRPRGTFLTWYSAEQRGKKFVDYIVNNFTTEKVSFVTNKGIALLAKLIAGETLHITRGETGSGYVTPGTMQSQVAVTSPMQQVSFREATYPEEGKCALTCFITNDGIEAAYTANQVGIYATDPDEGEILFFITQASSGKGMDIPTETEMPGYSSEWTFYFKYGQAGGVQVTVDPSNTVSFAEVETHVKAKLGEHTSDKKNPHGVTAEQVGAIPSTGGIVSGPITFKKGENPGTAKITKNHSETADYGLVVTDYDKDGKHASVVVRAKENKAYFVDNNDTYHALYHAGNKPTPRDVGAASEVANYVTISETDFDLDAATDPELPRTPPWERCLPFR